MCFLQSNWYGLWIGVEILEILLLVSGDNGYYCDNEEFIDEGFETKFGITCEPCIGKFSYSGGGKYVN